MLSYGDLLAQYLRNIGKAGSTDPTILADFKLNLGQRYQMALAKMSNYMTQQPKTASTVANQQYYAYPLNTINIEDVTITVGSQTYPLEIINSQKQWNYLNSLTITSDLPEFFFPRRDDFGIFPIPASANTITFNYHYRDRGLQIEDYNTGTITTTNGSTTITGSATSFSAYMVGLWLQVTDATTTGWGYWYRIGSYSSATSISLEQYWQTASLSGVTYRISQLPEIPEEGHIMLCDGATADFYAGMRSEIQQATWFNNKYWTGDGNNNSRVEGDQSIKGGLIGMMNYYADRNKTTLINRIPNIGGSANKIWSTTIS